MKIEEAKAGYEASTLVSIDLIPNTSIKGEWVILIKDREGKSYFLINQNEDILSFRSINDAVETMQSIGFRRAKLFF